MKRFRTFLFCLLASSFLGAEAPEIVQSIEIRIMPEENSFLERATKEQLYTKEGQRFSQTHFDRDLKELATLYYSVEPDVQEDEGRLYILLTLWEKPVIRSIRFLGNFRMRDRRLSNELGISPGHLYDACGFCDAFQKLRSYYIQKGFFEACLDYEVVRDPCSNCVDICIKIDEGRSGKVYNFCFKNFSSCEAKLLKELMLTKEYNPFTSWMTGEGIYREEMVEIDQFRILDYLQNQGYADAQVDIAVVEKDNCDGRYVQLDISACRGERYCLDEVTFSGNTLFCDAEIASCLALCRGQPYSPEGIRNAIERLSEKYGRCGYIETAIDVSAGLSDSGNCYSLHFDIDEGDCYRVGLVRVLGNYCTHTPTILHESLICPGEIFDICKLKRTECRLENIGFFSCVNVYPAEENACLNDEEVDHECRYRDVVIEVEECGTGQANVFGGFSTAESAFVGISLTERNFNIRGIPHILSRGLNVIRGGGEFLNISTNVGKKSTSYNLSWTKPYFMDTPWSLGFDMDKTDSSYQSDCWRSKAYGFGIHATCPIDAFTRFGIHYRLRNRQVQAHAQDKLEPKEGESDADFEKREKARKDKEDEFLKETSYDGLVSGIGASLIYDSTDSLECPSNGLRSRLMLEYVGVGGRYQWVSAAYINTLYWTPSPCCRYFPFEEWTLKLRADVKFIMPINRDIFEIPLDERLYLGGDDMVRGYRPWVLGPTFPSNPTCPRGGASLALFSAEYNHKLHDRLDLFFFADAGQIYEGRMEVFNLLKYSVGIGARVCIMANMPPITFGYGIPLNAKNSSERKNFFWQMGGRF